MKYKYLGVILIGIITAVAGYPIYNFTKCEFSFTNSIVVFGCLLLWNIILKIIKNGIDDN
jgi:hypothetical protein